MSREEEIAKAVNAHGKWSFLLKEAIAKGKSELSVDQAKMDNHCDFGRWFYGLPMPARSSEVCGRVRQFHAEFHQEAARVLGLALTGKKAEAEGALGSGKKFMDLSWKLATALNQWKSVP